LFSCTLHCSVYQMDAAAAFSSRFSAASVEERSASSAASLDTVLRPEQAFFLFNAAHAHTKIRSPDGSAWIRPLGFCPSIKAARARGVDVDAADPGVEIRMQPAGKVFLLGAQPYADAPGAPDMPAREREQAKANAAMERAHAKAAEQVQEVQRRAEKRLAGSLDLSRMNPAASSSAVSAADARVSEPKAAPAEASADAPPAAHATAARLGAIKDMPVSLEMRAQKFAVLAVLEDAEAAAQHAQRRRVWWKARCHVLRQAWCAEIGASAASAGKQQAWEETLRVWLSEHPAPSPEALACPPLFVDPALPEDAHAWLAARDEALLEAEWLAAGRALPHTFSYAKELGGQLDQPPAPPLEEPTVLAVGAADTLQDAEDMATRAGASPELKHVDVFVCAMYEWGRLGSRHAAAKKHARPLDDVMPSLKDLQ